MNNPRLHMLAVLLIPGIGLAACGRRAVGAGLLSATILAAVTPEVSALQTWAVAQLLGALFSIVLLRRGAR